MSEMIERVARAILAAERYAPEPAGDMLLAASIILHDEHGRAAGFIGPFMLIRLTPPGDRDLCA